MIENLTASMNQHVSKILEIKTKHPEVSLSDIITDYDSEDQEFDMEDFCTYLETNKSLKEFIRNDLIKFNHVKDPMLTWTNLF